MTVLVVVRKNNKVCIAADTAIHVNGVIESADINANHDKIFQFKDTWFAYTGNVHSSLMVKNALEKHGGDLEFHGQQQIYESLLELHQILKSHYFLKTENANNNQSVEDTHLNFLLANPSGIFQFYGDRYVGEISTYWAAGSGSRLALGATYATYGQYDEVKAIASAGIQAACKFDHNCELPMTYYATPLSSES